MMFSIIKINADTGKEYLVNSFDSFEEAKQGLEDFTPLVQSYMFIERRTDGGGVSVVWEGAKVN